MRLNDGLATVNGPGRRHVSSWRWFPWALVAAMAVVFAVNGVMVTLALGTFPGQAGSDGFDLSNHYDHVLDRVQREAALGWSLQASADPAGRPLLVLTDRNGAALRGATVTATAARPVGPAQTTALTFHGNGAGQYVADAALAAPGQWELQVAVTADGRSAAMTRRVVAPQPRVPARDGGRGPS